MSYSVKKKLAKMQSSNNNQVQQLDIMKEFGNRFVLFPIKYASVWSMYKKAVSAFWTAEEIDLSKDMNDWEKLSGNEQHFIKNILAFFAASDGIVNENLSVRFMNEIPVQEVKCFYGFQIAMENIHCVTGDTRILTSKGHLAIGALEGKMVDVWNGDRWSNVMIMKTSDKAPMMSVTLSNGMYLTCTPNHEWLIDVTVAAAAADPRHDHIDVDADADADTKVSKRIPASELAVGMIISPFIYPQAGYTKDELIFSHVELHGQGAFDLNLENDPKYNPIKFNCRAPLFVPINYGRSTQVEWLNGAMKNAMYSEDYDTVMFPHYDQGFVHEVQLMLTTLDVRSIVGQKVITIKTADLAGIGCIGCNVSDVFTATAATAAPVPLTITAAIMSDEQVPMFCFEEPHNHTGVFNGILTGQSETYSLLLDTYIKDNDEKNALINAIDTVPAIKKKAEWSMKWITDTNATFAMRLVAFSCVEGIFFSGAFCAIFWLKERGVLPGLCLSNEFISRDESLHTEFAVHLYSLLGPDSKLTADEITTIIKEAVEIEDEFINESISCNMLGMNTELMSQYIHFIADRLAVQLGIEPIFGAKNPFAFMDRICLSNKSNFFEHTRQSDYAKARIGDKTECNTFALDAEF